MKIQLRTITWLVAGLALGLLLVALLAGRVNLAGLGGLPAPRLASASPVGAGGPLRLTFAQPMQPESVAERLTLVPPVAGRLEWTGNTLSFWPAAPLQPGQRYTLRLAAGARSQNGQALGSAQSWDIEVRAPELLYLSPSRAPELWRLGADGPVRLTDTGGQLFDFAPSVDGSRIAYSAANAEGGIDLWELDRSGGAATLLLPCQQDMCANPAYSPDGTRIAYSRRQATGITDAEPGPPRLWLLDRASLSTDRVTADPNIGGYEPAWSPDGRYLAFFDGISFGVRVVDLLEKRDYLVRNEIGITGNWSPDSRYLLVGRYERQLPGPGFHSPDSDAAELPLVVIDAFDVGTGQALEVLGPEAAPADYSVPVYTPDGQWLAVARRLLLGLPAKQLWLVRPDGSQRQQITLDPSINYSGYRWSPDGSRLVYQSLQLGSSASLPQVGTWDWASQTLTPVAEDAFQPAWLP